uniref:Armadillo like helical domain containing 4 n=1 Tax=Chinchilla lanigera TaxID=34839 RepID=A0A8C2YKB1_CHILA
NSIAGIVNSANFCAHFSSTMSRSVVLHLCLAFGGLLFLNFATQCLSFPKREQEQSERMGVDDLENSSMALKPTPQLVSSEDAVTASAEPSVLSLNKILTRDKETQPTGAGLLQSSSAGLYIATELEIPAGEDMFVSSQPEGLSAESELSKATLATALLAAASLNPHAEEGPLSSSHSQPLAEGTPETTQSFLTYVDHQWFATESLEGVSLGHTPSSYVDPEEVPRMEKLEAATDQRTTSFPDAESAADTVPGSLPLLGAPEITVSVSSAVPASSVLSEDWDDTKLESQSQIRTSKGDSPEVTEMAEVGLGLPEGEALTGPALLTSQGDQRSPASTHLSSSAPTSLSGDPEFSDRSVFQGPGGVLDSTKEESSEFLAGMTAIGSVLNISLFKDAITQEMTTAAQDPEASLPLETQEEVVSLEAPRGRGDAEEAEEAASPVSGTPGVTQLPRGWGPVATTPSTTVAPLSPEVIPTSSLLCLAGFVDTVTLPNEEFTLVQGFRVTPAGVMVEVTGSSLPYSEGTVPSRSSAHTATPYGLEQFESEEGEDDEDEEDEDEDEEEDDEEEEEEDKDTDSLDESFGGDTELPGFTLPGVTSQEPGLERGLGDPLQGATYQVPDAIEWEQQNQGLVRSWMEKLKDKAGYMSGMLVPVGVGIAGALFILGALYSIKIMNRRRRNGFKRHKRKQREFNSMQDRVMLLADSSEDEF